MNMHLIDLGFNFPQTNYEYRQIHTSQHLTMKTKEKRTNVKKE